VPSICYEIGICIQTDWIVWINGPFVPGDWSNLSIAGYGVAKWLDCGEKYLVDGGYRSQMEMPKPLLAITATTST